MDNNINTPPNQGDQNNIGLGVFIMFAVTIGVLGFMFIQSNSNKIFDKYNNETNNVSNTNTEEEKEEETEEEPKEKTEEKIVNLTCKGTQTENNTTITTTSELVFKDDTLFTIKVVMVTNGMSEEVAKTLGKVLAYSGYSYSTSSDLKTITANGTINTLTPTVINEIGTLEKAKEYYKTKKTACVESEKNTSE